MRSQALAQKTDISQSRLKLIKIERALEEAAALEAERQTAKTREKAGNKETHAHGIHVTVIEEAFLLQDRYDPLYLSTLRLR